MIRAAAVRPTVCIAVATSTEILLLCSLLVSSEDRGVGEIHIATTIGEESDVRSPSELNYCSDWSFAAHRTRPSSTTSHNPAPCRGHASL